MYKQIEKAAAVVLTVLMVLSLLPVMYLGRFNHPTGDDYYYSAETRIVWENTGSITATLAEAIRGVAHDYQTWQGTYSAMFFMRLAPNVFSETAYQYVTAVLLLLLTGSIFFLLKPVICECLKGSRSLWLIVSSVLSIICIQTVPSQGETFFWYNGSMYYTGYFAVTVMFFGLIIRYLLRPRWYFIPVFSLLAILLAGGNYVSLLPAIILMVCLAIGLFYKHEYKKFYVIAMVAVLLLIGLGISALAPGNALRQDELWKIPAWKAILKSLLQGIKYLWAWMRGWWWIGIAIVTPFFVKSYKELACKTSWKFRYPVIVIGFAYGIFCSMSCPTFYSMNSTGPARVVSIVYYGFMLTSFFCYYYLLGYVYQKCKDIKGIDLAESGAVYKKLSFVATVVALALLLGQMFSRNMLNCTTVKAVRELASGEAKAYGQEYQERLALLYDENIEDVVLMPHKHTPDMLYVGDLLDNPEAPGNQKMAQFYGKKSVIVDWSGQ